MDKTTISEEARQARNAYQRQWRAANKERVKATNDRYWQRKAERAKAEREQEARS